MSYDTVKQFNGQKYKGMSVGGSHDWNYNNAVWHEEKMSPDLWKIRFTATKGRQHSAPVGSGAPLNTEYHWTIFADQRAKKIDENHYETMMEGLKFKTGYKKPKWKGFSYSYKDQPSAKEQKIKFLEMVLSELEQENTADIRAAGK